MSGYRDASNFDPMPSAYGPPLRPYNKVQWLGVAMQAVAFAAYGYYFAERFGWVRDRGVDTMLIGLPFLILGMSLTYSRRQEPVDLAPELAGARKRWLLITTVLCVALLGVATIIEFTRS